VLQALQVRAGIGAQLISEATAQPLIVLQRVGLPAAAVQGEHELAGHPFVEWIRRRPGGQRVEQLSVSSQPQRQVGVLHLDGEALPVQRLALDVQPRCVHAAGIDRLAGAPAQEDPQIRLGVHPGLTAVTPQVGGHCCPQDQRLGSVRQLRGSHI
jgi:hypothetical protein